MAASAKSILAQALKMSANDVLAWLKAQGPGYQTRINAVLRAFRDASL